MFQDRGHLQGAFPDTCTAECKTIFEPFYVRKCLFELSHRSPTLLVRVPQSQAECEERIGAENSYQASSEDARSYANCKRRRAALLGFVQPLKKTCEQSSQSARARLAAVTEARHPPRAGHCSCLNQRHSSVERRHTALQHKPAAPHPSQIQSRGDAETPAAPSATTAGASTATVTASLMSWATISSSPANRPKIATRIEFSPLPGRTHRGDSPSLSVALTVQDYRVSETTTAGKPRKARIIFLHHVHIRCSLRV